MELVLSITLVLAASAVGHIAPRRTSNISVSTSSYGKIYAPGDLIFEDHFDTLNLDVWHHEVNMNGGYNNEFQIYDRDSQNAFVRDGILIIKPTLTLDRLNGSVQKLFNGRIVLNGCTDAPSSTSCDRTGKYPNILPPVVSARLRTLGSFSFKYGRAEVFAKLPAGDWTWPAIWLQSEKSRYGRWPQSGEIDMMESRGNRKLFNRVGTNIGSEQVGSTLHFGPLPGAGYNSYRLTHSTRNSAVDNGYDRAFHLYQLEWTPEYIKFLIDGVELRTITPPAGGFFELGQFPQNITNPWVGAENFKMAPFDQSFHFVLNVAIGGSFFPSDAKAPYPRPWAPGSTHAFLDFYNGQNLWEPSWQGENHSMQIDYIRVYAV